MPGRNTRRQYNHTTGGYGGFSNDHLRNVALPVEIHCNFCKKSKPNQRFSKSEHAAVKTALLNGARGSNGYSVRCIPCSGGGPLEYKCKDCDTWKSQAEYAKAQRKNPDSATCLVCMETNLEFEPALIKPEEDKADNDSDSDSYDGSDAYESADDDEDDYEDDTSQVTTTNGTSSTITGFQSLSINGTTTTGSIVSSRNAGSYLSNNTTMNSTNAGSRGGVALNGSQTSSTATKQYGVPHTRLRTTAGAVDNRRFPKIPGNRGQPTPSENLSTVNNGNWSDEDEDVVESSEDEDDESEEDEDEDEDDDDEEDYDTVGTWRDGNAVGH